MTLAQDLVCKLVRPYTVREFPGWGKAYHLLVGGGANEALWAQPCSRTMRGKLHGYELTLQLGKWSERLSYFLGRYSDLPTQELMLSFLRKGDRYCDIGANIGETMLLGSYLVGSSGLVDAFEPNPECLSRLRETISRNAIENVELHEVGLGDVAGSFELSVKPDNSGEGTFIPVVDESFTIHHRCEVLTGDSCLQNDPRPIAMCKIDVEGFECRALAGLQQVLSDSLPLVVTEVVPDYLQQAGDSVDGLFDMMEEYGYRAREMGLWRSGRRYHLRLRDCADRKVENVNVAWIPTRGPHADRCKELLSHCQGPVELGHILPDVQMTDA